MSHSASFFRWSAKLLLSIVIVCCPLPGLAASAGKVEFSIGNVVAQGADGRSRPVIKGAEISAGDTIQTGDGRAQLKFTDGGYISLSPDTVFRVDEYRYDGKTDGSEKGFFSLLKGGLRAITGAVGHVHKKSYQVNTPVATIGIRGTEFLARLDGKLVVKVGDGAVFLSNTAGDLVLYKGQSGEVGGKDQKPRYSNETPAVNAAGPKGATPEENWEEVADRATYVVGEDVYDGSSSCVVSVLCSTTELVVSTIVHTNWDSPSGAYVSELNFGWGVSRDSSGRINRIANGDWVATAQSDVTLDSNGSYGTLSWGRWVGGHALVGDTTPESIALGAVHIISGPMTSAADMQYLAASNLVGTYSVVGHTTPTLTNMSTGATSNVSGSVGGQLTADFASGSVSLNLNAGAYSVSGASGVIDGAVFVAADTWGGGGTFYSVGTFSGTKAAQAGMTYQFDNGGGSDMVTGAVAFKQDSLVPASP